MNRPEFSVNVLGSGSAKPSIAHLPSSSVVNSRGNLFMIDCGEGAQRTFQKMRLRFSRLNHIFLTHLHGDHVLGLPGLVGTLALSGMGGSLTIHTFEEGRRVLEPMIRYFCGETPFDVRFNIISPKGGETIYENAALTVRTIALDHRVPTVGYVFEERPSLPHIDKAACDFHGVPLAMMRSIKEGADFVKEDGTIVPNALLTRPSAPPRSYAHISDTAYMPGLAEQIRDVDLLFHETTYLEDHADMAAPRGHSTARQAALVAREAGAGALLTGHYSSRYTDDNLFAEEARTIFPNVIVGHEGLRVPIGPQ